MLKKNAIISELTWRDSGGQEHTLAQYSRHKAVVFFFYPMDFTRVCTGQACYFRDVYGEIAAQSGVVFGVSLDDDATHEKFRTHHRLPYALIYDHDQALSKKFGTLWLWGLWRNKRVTYIIRPSDGKIMDVIHAERDAQVHADRVLAYLRTSSL